MSLNIKLERFVLGFGVFSTIICIVLTGVCLGGYAYLVGCIVLGKTAFSDYKFAILLVVPLTLSVISMAFSFLLVNGVRKKNPYLIKMYLIFGCTSTVLCIAGTCTCGFLLDSALVIAIALATCALYSLILFAILKTYIKMELATNSGDKQLINNNQYLFLEGTEVGK